MHRHDSFAAGPRLISSRSCGRRCSSRRFGVAGRTPPVERTYRRIVDGDRPKCRATRLNGHPFRLSSQTATAAQPSADLAPQRPLATFVAEIIKRGVALTL